VIYLCPIDPDNCEQATMSRFCEKHPGVWLEPVRMLAASEQQAENTGPQVSTSVPEGAACDPAPEGVQDAVPRLALRILGRVVPVPQGGLLLGRDAPAVCDLPGMADLLHVGRRHARIFWQADGLEVIDLDSINGTFLDGRRIERPEALRVGQTLDLAGDVELDVIELDEYGLPK
jgi:hypothetical protein